MFVCVALGEFGYRPGIFVIWKKYDKRRNGYRNQRFTPQKSWDQRRTTLSSFAVVKLLCTIQTMVGIYNATRTKIQFIVVAVFTSVRCNSPSVLHFFSARYEYKRKFEGKKRQEKRRNIRLARMMHDFPYSNCSATIYSDNCHCDDPYYIVTLYTHKHNFDCKQINWNIKYSAFDTTNR